MPGVSVWFTVLSPVPSITPDMFLERMNQRIGEKLSLSKRCKVGQDMKGLACLRMDDLKERIGAPQSECKNLGVLRELHRHPDSMKTLP